MNPAQAAFSQPLLSTQEMEALIKEASRSAFVSPAQRPRGRRNGEWVSPDLGSGVDFADARPYHPGDDTRRIDWRASARARSTFVRPVHAELDQSHCILIDLRAPMRFGTRRRLKAAQALRAALWIGVGLSRDARPVSLVVVDEHCQWTPAARHQTVLQSLTELGTRPCPPLTADDDPMPWRRLFSALQGRLSAGSQLFLISDFHGFSEQDHRAARSLGRHLNAVAVHIQDPSEATMPPGGRMEWIWGGRKERVDSRDGHQQERIETALRQQAEQLDTAFRRAAITAFRLRTDQDDLGPLPTAAW